MRSLTFRGFLVAVMSLTLLVSGLGIVSAAIIGGTGTLIAAPSDVGDSAHTNTEIEGFDERQGVLLAAPLAVDSGFIPAGTVVDSHMIFLNKPAGHANIFDTKTFTFDKPVLGVMSDSGGTLEAASNALLGNPATSYPGAFGARGMEGGDGYIVSGNTIEVKMGVAQPGDWIRVVTGCEYKASILGGSGIAGAGIDDAPGLQKCFNPKSKAAANAGKK